ncbi:N-acetylmuramoyl-L-alanine amidase [Listeria monocytogenes serotype 1/2b]|nr:N-acetylmuramoyl-L-alanine amidase [Listeria monocytogenes serotype 1/2b]
MTKLAIFAGHNGTNESGASGNGLTEKAVAKEAAQLATNYAKSCGHTVVNGYGKALSERVKYANFENVKAVLELHTNAGGGQGVETLFCAGIASAKSDATAVAKAGAIKGLKNRGAKADTSTRHGRLAIVRDTKAPALLHELFFIDSASDVKIWKANKKAIVESITKAWLQSQGLNAVPKKSTSSTSKPASSEKSSYYTENPKKIKTLVQCDLYDSVDFTEKHKMGGTYPPGTIFTIAGMAKTKGGTPRLKTKSGYYLTANTKFVKKI